LICGSTATVQKLNLLGYQNSIAGLIDTGTSPLLSSVLQSAMGDYLSGDLTAPAQKTSPEDSAAVKNKIPIRKRSGLGSRWDHWIDWLNGKTEIRINDWTGQKSQEEVLRRSYWSTSPTAYSPSTTSERITDCAGATRLVENLALYAPQHLQELRGEAGPQPGPEGPVSVVRRGDYEETFQVYDQIVEVVPRLLSTAATALVDARRARAMCSVSEGQQFDAAAPALDATSVELVKLYDDTLKKRSQLVFKLAGALEIIMTGSLGFWLTVGILGTWARLRVNSLAPEED
jgi:hypothetical protein